MHKIDNAPAVWCIRRPKIAVTKKVLSAHGGTENPMPRIDRVPTPRRIRQLQMVIVEKVLPTDLVHERTGSPEYLNS